MRGRERIERIVACCWNGIRNKLCLECLAADHRNNILFGLNRIPDKIMYVVSPSITDTWGRADLRVGRISCVYNYFRFTSGAQSSFEVFCSVR